ncbi:MULTISPECIES: histidine triad nucleotide-binding protein [Aquitalea]|jgi:histidine triad (HIT) family protein|uniref:Histidine triad (HIT) family protein n=3 Tax=Aquitalea TaxID=407217 RepID=A0A318J4B6_9NEIS|nr:MULTISPECIES: histidine triad nucleotide-binding protein [Aquitalea]MBA4707331.1 histidine triad nucleotide-binding protein [Aquitalea magnusonii]PXX43573.1 histidine triad (HIT) family protein [Aquitalea magnusonii]RMC97093.1 histidine triad nucleotide-binding protein [Aquitalea palustris]
MSDCIFCKIAAGDIPCNKIYEDADVVAFHDIRPIAPVHFLIIPKLHVASLADCGPEHEALLGRIMGLVPKLAAEQGMSAGFKTGINTGRGGGQEVFHLHVHVFGHKG